MTNTIGGQQGRMDVDLDNNGRPVRAVLIAGGSVRMGMLRESKGQTPETFAAHHGYRVTSWVNAGHAWVELAR